MRVSSRQPVLEDQRPSLPAATESLTLVVRYVDGTVTRGESVVHEIGKQVSAVSVEPAGIPAPPGVIGAIQAADMIVLAPGSLFTSTIPALLGGGVREALADFAGPVLYVANVMTQQGETSDFTVSDHVRAITEHVGSVVTDVLVHSGVLPPDILARYEAEEAAPVVVDTEVLREMGLRVRETELLAKEPRGRLGMTLHCWRGGERLPSFASRCVANSPLARHRGPEGSAARARRPGRRLRPLGEEGAALASQCSSRPLRSPPVALGVRYGIKLTDRPRPLWPHPLCGAHGGQRGDTGEGRADARSARRRGAGRHLRARSRAPAP